MITNKKINSVALGSAALVLFIILVSSTASAATITSNVVGTNYQYWSSEQYPLIDLFGEKYVPLCANTDPIWKSHLDKLAKLVIDSEGSYSLITGENFDLGQGYSLQVMQVDVDGQKVWVEFDKDGQYVNDQIISTDSGDHTWICTLDNIQGVNNVPVLKVHVNQIYQGATGSIAQIDGLWLIDYANAKTLQIGDKLGELTLTKIINGMDASNLGSLVFESGNDSVPFAYITNYGEETVSVIDTATNTVTDTVPVGNDPEGVAVSPDGTKVYVTSRLFLDVTDSWGEDTIPETVEIGTVSVIDTATNNVTASVNVGTGPQGIAVTPDGTKVYVTNEGSNTGVISTVSVIDTATNTVTATVNVGIRPRGIAVTPDGTKVYVMNYGSNNISVIDTANDTVTATVNAENPWGVAVSPDGTKVYVTNNGNNISVIDTATNTVTDTVPVGGCLDGVAVSPDGTKVYVTNGWYKGDDGPYYALEIGTVSVIDTATNTITATVGVGSLPNGVAVSPDGTKVYVTNFGSDNVSVIGTATNTVTASVNVGSMPCGVAVVPSPEPVEIQKTQITTGESASDPHIYGDRIVYEDSRNGNSDIYMYDLSTKQEAQISTSGTAKYPAIYGDRVVWKDDRNGLSDIYMYDIFTSQETQISTNGTAYSTSTLSGPDIYQDKIVWQEFGEYTDITNLVIYDLSTQQETQITTSGMGGVSIIGFYGFAVHGDKIVMCNPVGDDASRIIMYDLSTQQTTWIGSGKPLSPDIYGDRIVYEEVSWEGDYYEDSSYYYNIYVYDLSTQQEIQVSTSGTAYDPAIYSDRIVWGDGFNERNIYMYDLFNSKETQITTSGSAYSPDIYGDRIVWVEGNDIYMGTLSYPSVAKNVQSVLPAVDGSIRDGLDSLKDGIADDILDNSVVQLLDVERGDMPFEDRGIIEFDISKISGSVTNATLNLSVFSSNGPYPFKVDIFTYTGDGNLDLNDFNSGTHFSTFEYYGEETVQLDVTEFVENMVSSGAKYAAFNFQYVEPSAIPMNGPFVAFNSLEYPPAAKLTIVSEIFNEKPIAVLPVANFTANTTEGTTPLTVQFTGLSTNATSWNWDFGDGATSTDQNATHTYSAAGTYIVILTASNTNGTDSKLATITVLEQPVAPVADFSASPTVGKAPLTVKFTDQSTGSPTFWSWKFGDKITSTAQNPEHIYSKAGKYTVSLQVKNAVGRDTRKISKYIIVKK